MPRKPLANPRLIEVYRTIGDNILIKRGELKMTQEKLVELARVSRSVVSGAENGLGCSLENLILIADALGIKPADLFITGDERKSVSYQHIMLMDLLKETLARKK